MTLELIEAVHAAGADIWVEGTDLVIEPASKVSLDLKARLRDRKPELLNYLSRQSAICDAQDSWEWIEERAAILEFEAGMRQEEANHRAFMFWYRRFVSGDASQ